MPKKTAKANAPVPRRSPMEHPRLRYPEETATLRSLAESCGLKEKIKWGKPCFTLEDRNVVLIQPFKDYIALLFFQGALLDDPGALLSRVGEHMQAPRQLRFRSLAEITRLSSAARAFIEQAIALAQSGAKVAPEPHTELQLPEELQSRLDADPELQRAFHALTPGRRKGYVYQIAEGKQSATRAARVDKHAPRILAGKGLHD